GEGSPTSVRLNYSALRSRGPGARVHADRVSGAAVDDLVQLAAPVDPHFAGQQRRRRDPAVADDLLGDLPRDDGHHFAAAVAAVGAVIHWPAALRRAA